VGLFDFFTQLFGKGSSKGKRLDVKKRFDLLSRTGQGSMSKVWKARDRQLGKVVALKLLDKEKTAKFEARFPGAAKKPKEGEICVLLRHPNIVRTYEHGITTEGEPYLVMELVDGLSFNYLVETRNNALEGHRVNFLIQMAEGLAYLHKQGYLHRDICPRNLMLSKDNEVKLIDFGLAIPNTPEFLKPGNRTGTTAYLAPEVIRRSPTDSRVDMFALGVTAYELYTFDLPWEKTQSVQVLLSHMHNPGKDPREHVPDLDDETAEFLIKAVERDPRKRFQTPAQFKEALENLPER